MSSEIQLFKKKYNLPRQTLIIDTRSEKRREPLCWAHQPAQTFSQRQHAWMQPGSQSARLHGVPPEGAIKKRSLQAGNKEEQSSRQQSRAGFGKGAGRCPTATPNTETRGQALRFRLRRLDN